MEWFSPGVRGRGSAWHGFVSCVVSLAVGCGNPATARTPLVGATAPPGTGTPSSLTAVSLTAVVPAGPSQSVATPAASGTAPNAVRLESPVPVLPDDATWGDPSAPVEMIVFLDLQCRFCRQVQQTLAALRERYGRARLHLVTKHLPLPFHVQAHLAAQAARAVQELAGPTAFEGFLQLAYLEQAELDREHLLEWAERVGAARARVEPLMDSDRIVRRIDLDVAVAGRVGVVGTPGFLINGLRLPGAQPLPQFTEVIDKELVRTADLAKVGVPATALSVVRTRENFVPPVPAKSNVAGAIQDSATVWDIPLGKSPRLGDPGALVTIVEFADFQCPFSKRVQATLDAVRTKYGRDVRLVFKHNPLPFHPWARPAAMLALEARAEKGDDGFWRAAKLLFATPATPSDADLDRIGRELALDPKRVRSAVESEKYRTEVLADKGLALDFNARGTPYFFIDGRRLQGAQGIEAFSAIVDEELAKARALVASGVPRPAVYAAIMKTAKAPAPPERKEVRVPATVRPSRGPATAPVTIEIFGDLECPFTRRAMPTLDALERAYPGKLRIVFRNLPLSFHLGAEMAAEAALEVFAQGKDAAYWKILPLIQAGLDDPAPLTEGELVRDAVSLGVDGERLRAALRDGRHRPAIDDDRTAAAEAGIQGTPAFLVNGYFISGAQPLEAFARVIDRALQETHRGPRPK